MQGRTANQGIPRSIRSSRCPTEVINTPLVTVAGNYDVNDDIIFCDVLQFVGISPQLVIRPMPGAKVGARRLLKIVANVIDTTGSTGATITYNMDNNFEL